MLAAVSCWIQRQIIDFTATTHNEISAKLLKANAVKRCIKRSVIPKFKADLTALIDRTKISLAVNVNQALATIEGGRGESVVEEDADEEVKSKDDDEVSDQDIDDIVAQEFKVRRPVTKAPTRTQCSGKPSKTHRTKPSRRHLSATLPRDIQSHLRAHRH